METHLDWLLAELEPRSESVRELLALGLDADFFCYSAGSTDKPPSLPHTIQDRARALGIPIGIDHHQDRTSS